MKRILLFLLLGISSHLVQSQQYIYIDALNGNDANNGSTEALAKKTFSYVNTRVLAAGTQVLLKKGCVWNQRLEVRGRGTADNWISVGSYGTATAKPIIRLTNHKDDIALLICDLDRTSGTVRSQNMSYVEIKDIQIENTRIGIYWRNVMTTDNTGFRVKNVTFNNVWCDDVMWTVYNSTNRPTETANQLSAIKGNLQTTTGLTNGGVKEYYFPTAIRIGGIPKNTGGVGLTVNGINYTVLRELEISDCQFNNCLEGIGVGFYHYLASGQGANVWRQTFHKLKFSNCTATGVVNGMYSLDAVNCGAVVGPGGAIQPDANGWGLIKNMQVLEGSSTLPRTSWTGTTGVMLNNTQLLLIDSCLYQNMKNMGNPDGCGFDFETNNDRITLQRTRFFTNDGHSILLMNGGNFGGNTNIVIQNNLFSGNIVSGDSQHELNFSRKEDGHANVQVRNNIFFMRKLNRNNQSISLVDPTRTYATTSNNDLYYLDSKSPSVVVNYQGNTYSYNATPSNLTTPTAKSLTLVDGGLYTDKTDIQLACEMDKGVPSHYLISENDNFSNTDWKVFSSTIPFTLSNNIGLKTIYFKLKNVLNAESSVFQTQIAYKPAPEKLSGIRQVKISPNPVSSYANIAIVDITQGGQEQKISSNDTNNITIRNSTGAILSETIQRGSEFVLNTSNFPSGVLFVKITSDSRTYTKSILKY